MLEVEPDVVFYASGGKYLTGVSRQTASELRGMSLRVTEEGLQPARELMPSE